MLPLEFDAQVARLRNHFTDRVYTSEFTKLLFRALKPLPDGVFAKMVDHLILTAARPPLLPEFAELAAKMASGWSDKPNAPRVACGECNNHGYFLVKCENSGSIITASCERCATGAGLRMSPAHPIIGISDAKRRGFVRIKKLTELDAEDKPWVSAQAPGIPASVEALCLSVKSGRTNTGGFRFGLRHCRLTEDELFTVYGSWLKGIVHPLALKSKPSLIETITKKKSA